MKRFYFWMIVALLGFVLYMSPGFFVRRMYEGFTSGTAAAIIPPPYPEMAGWLQANPPPRPPPQEMQRILAPKNLPPAPAPAPEKAPPALDRLAEIQALFDTPTVSPTAPPQTVGSSGAKQQPQEYDTSRSRPANPRDAPEASMALEHGRSFNDTRPITPEFSARLQMQAPLLARSASTNVPSAAAAACAAPQQPIQQCNPAPPETNPNCPDMRDYIRKDSIPCWGCKLK